jgi:hypothetical protein
MRAEAGGGDICIHLYVCMHVCMYVYVCYMRALAGGGGQTLPADPLDALASFFEIASVPPTS